LMDFVAEHPDYLPALDMLSWFVLKEYLERSGVEANIVVRMMGKHGQVETSLAILRAGAAANEQVLAAIAQNEHWEYFLHVENAQELERDAVYLRDRLAELKVDMFRYSTHRAVELGQEDDKTNGLLYPITLYCDSREHQMGINTMTKAAQIWYAIGSGPYVETPYTGGGLLNGRNGELLSNPEKKIPLCGWNGKGGPWPWIETTPNTIFPDLDINTRISVKYRELYSDEIIGPMVIQFRHQYGGRERVLKLTMCNSSGCWDDGMRHGSQMGGP